jgi:hypothetical protein
MQLQLARSCEHVKHCPEVTAGLRCCTARSERNSSKYHNMAYIYVWQQHASECSQNCLPPHRHSVCPHRNLPLYSRLPQPLTLSALDLECVLRARYLWPLPRRLRAVSVLDAAVLSRLGLPTTPQHEYVRGRLCPASPEATHHSLTS